MIPLADASSPDTAPSWWLRLHRAKSHFDALNEGVQRFQESDVYRLGGQYNPNGKTLTIRAYDVMQPSNALRVLIGDCLHNLRSALDHLAFDLAIANLGTLPQGIEESSAFPIFDREAKFRHLTKAGEPDRRSGLYKIQGIAPEAQREIEALQPYHRRKLPDARWLRVLRELSDSDKHRQPHLMLPVLAPLDLRITGAKTLNMKVFRGRPLKEKAIVARARVRVPQHEGKMEVEGKSPST